MIDLYNATSNQVASQSTKWSPFVLRMELNRESLESHRITIDDIAKKIKSCFSTVSIMNSDINDDDHQIIWFWFQVDDD